VSAPVKDMVWVAGGRFRMGSDDFYPEERPAHQAEVDGFWIDRHPVTNAQFRRFVKATGYVTVAEQAPDPAAYPDADPALLVPGALVFQPTRGPVDLREWRNWWAWVPGANWRNPEGPGSTLHGRDRHPVVQVCYADALAYATWAGKLLPGEAEWEYAARGGLEGKVFCWGDEPTPKGRQMANTWQGEFPWQNLLLDRWERTSPVGSFPPNGYGLYDMAGNVWEWTGDDLTLSHAEGDCCAPVLEEAIPRRVIKGGSHLCAPSYCLRYRPAARQGEAVDTATSHIGFRCLLRDGPPAARPRTSSS
jgi:formylglycine-generating enzyme